MRRPLVVGFALLALAGPALAWSPPAQSRSDPSQLDAVLDAIGDMKLGGGTVGFGIDVSPLRPWSSVRLAPADSGVVDQRYQLVDPGTAVSFDLKLSWPSNDHPTLRTPLQPYVMLGPALLMPEPNLRLVGPPPDRPITLGVRAGAGVNWPVDQNATLFGEYRYTHGASDTLLHFGGKSASEVGGFDLLYGVRFRF